MDTTREHTIVIVDSLTEDFIGEGYEHMAVHVGPDEAKRVLGSGEDGFRGPLPLFLRQAVRAQQEGQNVGILNVRDWHDPTDPRQIPELLRYGNHNIVNTPGAEVVQPVAEIYRGGRVENLDVTALSIPIVALRDAVLRITGIDMLAQPELLKHLKFVVAGTHTNIRVFDTADSLQHKLGCRNVVVCPHLVASSNRSDHDAALRSWLPGKLIRVAQSVREVCEFTGIERPSAELVSWTESCQIEPAEVAANLNTDQRAILETIFMGKDSVTLTPLGGGFSGSLLLLGKARKNGSVMEPVVIKIDKHTQIKREADGYAKVKDLLGGRVPGFDPPVSMGEYTGVKIGLAALYGTPRTFQAVFEEAKTSGAIGNAERILGESLETLNERLYKNTKHERRINPVKQLSLSRPQNAAWLKENTAVIAPGQEEKDEIELAPGVVIKNPLRGFEALQQNSGEVDVDVCTAHRDLNFANHILDERRNVWFIDWANCDEDMLEVDFAKMENDIKFVMTKDFTEADLIQLQIFEKYLLAQITLPTLLETLPPELDFVRTDMRFQKVYRFVSRLRTAYADAKGADKTNAGALRLYQMALLRYSTHTLSFDARRGRGECELPALKYALLSTSLLVEHLA